MAAPPGTVVPSSRVVRQVGTVVLGSSGGLDFLPLRSRYGGERG